MTDPLPEEDGRQCYLGWRVGAIDGAAGEISPLRTPVLPLQVWRKHNAASLTGTNFPDGYFAIATQKSTAARGVDQLLAKVDG